MMHLKTIEFSDIKSFKVKSGKRLFKVKFTFASNVSLNDIDLLKFWADEFFGKIKETRNEVWFGNYEQAWLFLMTVKGSE